MKTIYVCITLLLLAIKVEAQTWQVLGQNGYVTTNTEGGTIALNSTGVPYIAYSDYANNTHAKATVVKLVDSSWQYVGMEGFSDSMAAPVCIFIGKNDTPYVAYIDAGDSSSITVKKFDGANWLAIGAPGFSGSTNQIAFAVNNDGIPYVAFKDEFDSNKVSVMKYSNSAWTYVGTRGMSAGEAGLGSIAIDNNNTPYLAYTDETNFGKATVMKFDSNLWAIVGIPGFTDTAAINISIALNKTGTPYIAYINGGQINNELNVMKFNDTEWVPGPPNFSPGNAASPSMAINKNGVPYVVYVNDSDMNYNPSQSASVMQFDGSNWVYVGNEGFSNCYTGSASIAIDSSGTPYVVYTAQTATWKVIVEKYAQTTGILPTQSANSVLNIYPNPTNNKLEIEIQNPVSNLLQITVMDVSGQTLMHQTISPAIKNEMDVSALPAGLYFIQLQDAQQSMVRKFVKE